MTTVEVRTPHRFEALVALLDTGAMMSSYLKTAKAHELGLEIREYQGTHGTASGPLQIDGQVEVQMRFGGKRGFTTSVNLLLTRHLMVDMVIGMEYMNSFQAKFDLGEGLANIGGTSVRLLKVEERFGSLAMHLDCGMYGVDGHQR
jgi:hypothetical protein